MSKCEDTDLGRLLHAYELGGLSEEDAESFEIHLLECEHCFGELKAFEEAAALLCSDQEVAELVGQNALGTEGSPGSVLERLWHHLWPDAPLVFKPILAYLLVLLLILPAYWGLRRSPVVGINPPQVMTLLPEKSPAEGKFQAGTDRDGELRFEFRDAIVNQSYLVLIESENGENIYRNRDFNTFDDYGWGELIIPHARMSPGYYKLTIAGPRKGLGRDTSYYYFRVVP
jgi:hypothetical protein